MIEFLQQVFNGLAIGAVYTLIAHLIGLASGPWIVGAISDRARSSVGEESLRFGLMGLMIFFFWAAAHFLMASRTLERDLQRASQI